MIEVIANIRIFFVVFVSAVLSQGIKTILNVKREKRDLCLRDLVLTGGMPSTHSALVSSLFAILMLETGLSAVTSIAMVLFVIVVTDSMGVRRTAGEEAKIVNRIIKEEHLRIRKMHYSLGHIPIEVLVGIIMGFFVAVSVWLLI